MVSEIENSQVVIISGDTGCGKTAQVPQLVLDAMIRKGQGARANMIITQPRRISAVGVSERIAKSAPRRSHSPRDQAVSSHTPAGRHDGHPPAPPPVRQRLAGRLSHFVDEVHERDLNTDFLLIIVKQLLDAPRPEAGAHECDAQRQDQEYFKVLASEACRPSPTFGGIQDARIPLTRSFWNGPRNDGLQGGSVGRFCDQGGQGGRDRDGGGGGRGGGGGGKGGGRGGGGGSGGRGGGGFVAEQKDPLETHLTTRKNLNDVREAYCGKNSNNVARLMVAGKLVQARTATERGHSRLSIVDETSLTMNSSRRCLSTSALSKRKLSTAPSSSSSRASKRSPSSSPRSGQRALRRRLRADLSVARLANDPERQEIFKVPPPGVQKIVVGTNIAETSITIEDVVYVIDAGRVKENQYDDQNKVVEWKRVLSCATGPLRPFNRTHVLTHIHTRALRSSEQMPMLVETHVSRASARQRRGRYGPVFDAASPTLFSSRTHALLPSTPCRIANALDDLVLQILGKRKLESVGRLLSRPSTLPCPPHPASTAVCSAGPGRSGDVPLQSRRPSSPGHQNSLEFLESLQAVSGQPARLRRRPAKRYWAPLPRRRTWPRTRAPLTALAPWHSCLWRQIGRSVGRFGSERVGKRLRRRGIRVVLTHTRAHARA